MNDILDLTARGLLRVVRERKLGAEELARVCIERIERFGEEGRWLDIEY